MESLGVLRNKKIAKTLKYFPYLFTDRRLILSKDVTNIDFEVKHLKFYHDSSQINIDPSSLMNNENCCYINCDNCSE